MKIKKLTQNQKTAIMSLVYPLFSLAIILALWAFTAWRTDSELIIPSVGRTFEEVWKLLSQQGGQPWIDIACTLLRAFRGFALSFAIALGLSLAAAFVKPLAKLLSPVISVMRSTPTMSVILLCLLWMHDNTQSAPVFVTVLIIFPLLYASFYSAITGVDRKLAEMAKVYKVPFLTRLTKLYIPSVMPTVFSSVRSTLSLTVKLTIAAEVLAQTKNSMGVNMQLANLYLDTPILIAWTLIAIILGAILELIVLGIEKLCMRWKNA